MPQKTECEIRRLDRYCQALLASRPHLFPDDQKHQSPDKVSHSQKRCLGYLGTFSPAVKFEY